MVQALAAASDKLAADFGSWKTPWGDINRFQRLTDDIVHPFSDAGPSIPVGFSSARWGSLASYGARSYQRVEEDVRHDRQQLRRGCRVRRARSKARAR
jgi:acyl-homoserine lactone acylase PvdQ